MMCFIVAFFVVYWMEFK